MPVELFREVPAHRRSDSTVVERVAFFVALTACTVVMLWFSFVSWTP